jgi:acetone carboxylase gamma subunit
MSLTVSVEFLYHFRCHECDRWWSVGDYAWVDKANVICPHCGYIHELPSNPLFAEDFKPQTTL